MFWVGVLLAVFGLGGGAYLIVSANGRRARNDKGIALVIFGTAGMVVLMMDACVARMSNFP